MKFFLIAGIVVRLLISLGLSVEAQEPMQTNPYGNVPRQAELVAQEPTEKVSEEIPRNSFGSVVPGQQESRSREKLVNKENLSPSENLWSLTNEKPSRAVFEERSPVNDKLIPNTFGNVNKTGVVNPFGSVPLAAPTSPFGNVPYKARPSRR